MEEGWLRVIALEEVWQGRFAPQGKHRSDA